MTDLDENGVRRLLAHLAAAGIAGGQPVHEVESDIRHVARTLGHRDVQIQGWPTGVIVGLGGGTPATFETVEGTLRLDQSAATAEIRLGLLDGTITAVQALDRLAGLRAAPHRYPKVGLHGGMALITTGIAMVLQPFWAGVAFSLVAGQVVAACMRLGARWRSLAVLTPFLAAFLVALGAFASADAGWLTAPVRALLPPIAVLLPGALIVTGVSELAAGAMTAGTARLAFGSGQLLLFTLGILGASWVLHAPADAAAVTGTGDLGAWAPFAGVLLVTLGISLLESVPPRLVPWVALLLTVTLAVQVFGQTVVGSRWAGALLGATVASCGAALVELYRPQLPRLVVFLPSFWLLVPGSLGLVSLTQLGTHAEVAVASMLEVVAVVSAIALGLLVGTSSARMVAIARTRRQALARRRRAGRAASATP